MSRNLSSRGRYQLLWCRSPRSKYSGASWAASSGKARLVRRQPSGRGLSVDEVTCLAPVAAAASTICSISVSFRPGMIGSRRRLKGIPAPASFLIVFNLRWGEGALGSSFRLRFRSRVVIVKLTTQRILESRSMSRETMSDFVIICTLHPSLSNSSRQARVSLSLASIGGYGSLLFDMLITKRLSIRWTSRSTRTSKFFLGRHSKARGIKEVT